MGDRTTVYLTVPVACAELAKNVIQNNYVEWHTGEAFLMGTFTDVNYGDLGFLSQLADVGIPYESAWDSGYDYGAGVEYGRFTPEGEYIILTVYEDARNPDLGELLKRVNKPDELIQYIVEYSEEITPLPWDNQIEYGKIYRTKQLIAA